MSDFEYQEVRRVTYKNGAVFVPVCEKCGRFVKGAEEIVFDWQGQPKFPTADCKKCGKTNMLFEGYY